MMRTKSGLPDPTADKAIGHVTAELKRAARRPLVYICSPYRGDVDHNVEQAKRYCLFAIDQHMTPLATHLLYPQILGEQETKETRELALNMGRQIIRKCRELWWFGDQPSAGMKAEIDYANRQALIIRHFTENCEEVSAT